MNERDGLNLLNDYTFEQLDSTVDIERVPHAISNASLNIAVLYYHGAKVEEREHFTRLPYRILRELNAANSIWSTTSGSMKIKINIVYSNYMDFPGRNTETLDEGDIIELIREGRRYYRTADAYVFYIEGDSVMTSNTVAKAVSRNVDNKVSYGIIMSDGAYGRILNGKRVGNEYILAHELGHIMYFTNYSGDIKDPVPNDDTNLPNGTPDYGHHDDDTPEERRNLMSPVALPYGEIPEITEIQIAKALQSSFFQD